jgi:DNA-binding CsgD family transcriptional regulator
VGSSGTFLNLWGGAVGTYFIACSRAPFVLSVVRVVAAGEPDGFEDVVIPVMRVLSRIRSAGTPSAVVVAGETGPGYTSATHGIIRRAGDIGFVSGRGGFEPGLTGLPPLAALLWALRSQRDPVIDAGDFAALADLYERPPWLVDRIADLLDDVSAIRPVLIVLEDADGADDLSIAALGVLAGRLRDRPMAWVLTARNPLTGAAARMTARLGQELSVATVPVGWTGYGDIHTGPAAIDHAAWETLTDAERRVVALVADGHSNKSAATELFLSPNTVATHLRAAYGKLGVSSRLQLAKVAVAQDKIGARN